MIKSSLLIISFILAFMVTSCASYIIPKDSFVNQLANVDSTNLKSVIVKGPTGVKVSYKALPLENIICYDKTGKQFVLINSPSIEMRITRNNGKKIIFYFDRIILIKDKLYGIQSRFFNNITSIPLSDISKIEVQDGKKKFSYVK